MSGLFRRAARIYREEGATALVRNAWSFWFDVLIRSHLPRVEVEYNGVRVRAARITDAYLSNGSLNRSHYESGIIEGICSYVKEGDHVVVVGGGWGVSTVVAAEASGETGSVTVYEASRKYSRYISETTELNSVAGRVKIHHAVVGRVVSMRGLTRGADRVPPDDLPNCDVLVMDCEGAELTILSDMSVRPRHVVVETHGELGSSENVVVDTLNELGYRIESTRVADESVPESCRERGLFVLVASKK